MDENPLDKMRQEIDAIDKALLPLFLKRMQCSKQVAKIKLAAKLPVLHVQREQEIIAAARAQAGDLDWAAQALYTCIMAVSRQCQQMLLEAGGALSILAAAAQGELPQQGARVLCQGVLGAYSHKAAGIAFPKADIQFCSSFADVFAALEAGQGDFAVVPVENSAAGSVTEVYGLIMQHRTYIVKAVSLSVSHCIASKGDAQVNKVLSHPQALLQCKGFLEKRGYAKQEFSNTAAAACFVAQSAEKGLAAICAKDAAQQYGLTILEENIQDDMNNHTRFAVVAKSPIFSKSAEKISLCFSLPNETGSLYRVLESFALGGLSLTKIESRPISGRNFEYDFYLDFAGSLQNPGITNLLTRLEKELPRFCFLGNYQEIVG